MSATFKVKRVELGTDRLSVVMYGRIVTGTVAPGMIVEIPFNNSFSIGCEIECITEHDEDISLVVAASETEEAEFVASFNPIGETLNVVDQ